MPRLALTALLLILVSACSASGPPTPLADTLLTADAVESLLTKSDLEAAGGDASGLDQHSDDLFEVASAIDATVASTTEALWSVRWTASGRPGVLMTLTRFHAATDAHAALDKIELGVAYAPMADAVGDRSALSPANADIGVAITFVHDRTLVALQLPVASDGATLLDEQQMLDLAIAIDAKL